MNVLVCFDRINKNISHFWDLKLSLHAIQLNAVSSMNAA